MEDKSYMKVILQLCVNNRLMIGVFVLSGLFYQCQTKQNTQQEGMSIFVGDKSFDQVHKTPVAVKLDSIGKMLNYKTSSGTNEKAFYIEAPQSNKTLLVFHEWWGLNDNIKKECQVLSERLPGVNILAIDLYSGQVATSSEEAGKLMQAVNKERALENIKTAVNNFAKGHVLGSIGWCFGGGWSLQSAILLEDQLRACVIYYGMPEMDASKLVKIKAQVLGIFAERDAWITPEIVKSFDETMKAIGKDFKPYSFPAEHAFANPSGSRYDEGASEEANKISINFLMEFL